MRKYYAEGARPGGAQHVRPGLSEGRNREPSPTGRPRGPGAASPASDSPGRGVGTRPGRDRDHYIQGVIARYEALRDTPRRASAEDRGVASALYGRGVPLWQVVAALHLVQARRNRRAEGEPVLSPIRSLAYCARAIGDPWIDELSSWPADERASYLRYLRGAAA